jgi:hypothetical protein
MEKHQTYFNLFDAFKEKGCPFCFLIQKVIHNAMDSLLYEQVNDPGVRKDINKSLGFCNLHAWQLQKFGDGLGLSIIYKNLIEIIISKMKKGGNRNNCIKLVSQEFVNNRNIEYQHKIKASCPMCRLQRETEERYLSTFLEDFHEPELYMVFKDSFGLCLPHLLKAFKMCNDAKIFKEIINVELEKLDYLSQELEEFRRKHDYRFSHEGFGKEKDSWIRAIEKMIGKEGIY